MDGELFARVEAARGDVSRTVWIRRAVEKALDGGPSAAGSSDPQVPGTRNQEPPTPSRPSDVKGTEGHLKSTYTPKTHTVDKFELPKIAKRKP